MLSLLLLAAQVRTPDIVVTGERLEAAHAECKRGGCSPMRDAQISIEWAESRFRAGAYLDAKSVLAAALRRNGKHYRTDPRPVSALYAAHATVSWQEGDQETYRRATTLRARMTRRHLPVGDTETLASLIAMGDMMARLRQPDEADRAYKDAERLAIASGRTAAAVRATLTRAWLMRLRDRPREAAALVAAAEARAFGAGEIALGAVRAMRLRLAVMDGDPAAIAAARAAFGTAGATRPVLIEAPPFPEDPVTAAARADERQGIRGDGANGAGFARTGTGSSVKWADLGFWIRPDGRTAEATLLRGSRDTSWAGAMLLQVAGRRYRPLAMGADTPGLYRVERVSLRPNYAVPIGSLITRRMGAAFVETLDLTEPGSKPEIPDAEAAG